MLRSVFQVAITWASRLAFWCGLRRVHAPVWRTARGQTIVTVYLCTECQQRHYWAGAAADVCIFWVLFKHWTAQGKRRSQCTLMRLGNSWKYYKQKYCHHLSHSVKVCSNTSNATQGAKRLGCFFFVVVVWATGWSLNSICCQVDTTVQFCFHGRTAASFLLHYRIQIINKNGSKLQINSSPILQGL